MQGYKRIGTGIFDDNDEIHLSDFIVEIDDDEIRVKEKVYESRNSFEWKYMNDDIFELKLHCGTDKVIGATLYIKKTYLYKKTQ